MAMQRHNFFDVSHQISDLDKSVTHLTEAILLASKRSQDVVYMFSDLAYVLIRRFTEFKRPEDIRTSVQYLRFLRNNFHSLASEAFSVHGELTVYLIFVLAKNLILGSGEMVRDMEELVAIIPEFLASYASKQSQLVALSAFADAVNQTDIFQRKHTQQVTDRVITILREATVLNPDLYISFALGSCLSARFQTTHMIDDYEEAIAIADKLVAATPGQLIVGDIPENPLMTDGGPAALTLVLLRSRLDAYPRPEYLEDTIHRFRTLIPTVPAHLRTAFSSALEFYTRQRLSYFGVAENSRNPAPDLLLGESFPMIMSSSRRSGSVPEDNPVTQTIDRWGQLKDILVTILEDETTIVEVEAAVGKAVELSRTFLPLQQSSHQWSFFPAMAFAEVLLQAHIRTNKLDYLNKSITLNRDLLKALAQTTHRFNAGRSLLSSLIKRYYLLQHSEDIKEVFQLFPLLVNDESGEVFARFKISYEWATGARLSTHPSMSTAYETAMSLMQESLVFSPTLQTQHFRLAHGLRKMRGSSSDYASYQIETGRVKQAIETLERGRALLWNEMRGFRTSTDQLCAAEPVLADKLADINRRLESVMMTDAQNDSEDTGDGGKGIGHREGMDSIGRLVITQRRLFQERASLVSRIQSLPGFEDFLKPPSFDVINAAAAHGPIIIINQSQFSSHIILLLRDSLPFVISTPFNFHDRANRLKDDLLRVRNDKEKGLDSMDYEITLTFVLAELYELVGKPVIEKLRKLEVSENSRIWWCPTDAFCSLPLHAMGPIPSNDGGRERYFMDLYTTSYTPTLSALIESRRPRSLTSNSPSLLLVAQPDTLPGAWGEIAVIQTTKTPVTSLISDMATPSTVLESLRDHQFAHFVCHGLLETGKPFDASFELHGDNLTLLEIVRSHLPTAEFAFLSACHTAELTEDSVADEGLHLAAAMQYCGFRSVVGTMWAMADTDGADLSKHFYKTIFSDRAELNGVPYSERSARALQLAVKKLRRKRGVTLERWVNFVHGGA